MYIEPKTHTMISLSILSPAYFTVGNAKAARQYLQWIYPQTNIPRAGLVFLL